MGRKLQGAKLRAKKRGQEASKELVETTAKHVETKQVTEKTNDELFVIDTKAVLPSKKTALKKEKKAKHVSKSAKEQAQIDKLIAKHTKEQLDRMAKKSKQTARKATNKGTVKPKFDLWGSSPATSLAEKQRTTKVTGIKPSEHVKITTSRALPPPKKVLSSRNDDDDTKAAAAVKVDLAKSGQSYNPDKLLHRKAILEAVQVEKKREKAEELRKAPISTGMSEETRKYIVGDTDSEDESDSDNDDDNDNKQDSVKVEKPKEKLTRAQRNKQKRLRAEQREIQERKRRKKLEGSIGEAKTITKQLRKADLEKRKQKTELEHLKIASTQIPGKGVYEKLANENPIHAPTYPVALSTELNKKSGYSLRSIKPKGSLLTDRFTSLLDRDMAPKKQTKRKKRVEGKRRMKMRIKVKGKGYKESKDGQILG